MSTGAKREIDSVTGVETTGHEWDGIKELNKPLPRWWVWTFYATIVWSIGYWIVYPAWPTLTDYTRGLWGYSQRATVAQQINDARAAQGGMRDKLDKTPLADVRKDADLLRFAMAGGKASFQTNCAPCHGRGAEGFIGYPNLNDDDWLWGGKIEEIYDTIQYGIRSGHAQARQSQMPRYGLDELLTAQQIDSVAEYVLSLSGKATNPAAVDGGKKIFAEQCAGCHGADAKGIQKDGSPNLTDGLWLHGGSKAQVVESIRTGRGSQMPWWVGRLDQVTLKSLAVYVHSLGGGK
ncbi:MAG TPA: cytochrome-c oxidase, cbb3-type subunit III [Hyphomicrobiaceae bacterium]|nr:cytochrome-c oxidase, cbb3-type subunit III [Hyphomicrobiaceae bacterium]